jgi:hypothetical protein
MELSNVTFRGPPIDDEPLLARLPANLQALLRSMNGFIQYHGGLHVRGASEGPAWHSLRAVLEGESALHAVYEELRPEDVPFGQDCVGDQFLLRDGQVHRLLAETGEIEFAAAGLRNFFEMVQADPVEFLKLHPLLQLQSEGAVLQPGELIHAYPPFCTKEAAQGVSLRAVPAQQVISFHAAMAAQLPPDGQQFKVEWVDG